jgi:hypothetical protein
MSGFCQLSTCPHIVVMTAAIRKETRTMPIIRRGTTPNSGREIHIFCGPADFEVVDQARFDNLDFYWGSATDEGGYRSPPLPHKWLAAHSTLTPQTMLSRNSIPSSE